LLPSSADGAAEDRPRFLAFAAPCLENSGISLRPSGEADGALIAAIYATTREDELRQVEWSVEQKKAFTDWQSQQQELHYTTHYPHCERLVVAREQPIGRIYVDTTSGEVRLMDVTLLPEHRNQGVGSRLMEAFLAYADGLGRQSSLHVEPFNPAKRMYERLGFRVVETRGLYEYMVRDAS
jgi:ribosomal protein S18 acetylase RimI-like enzyme